MKRAAKPARVVIDTNLVLSALVFTRGRVAPQRQAWQTRRILPLISRPTAEELIRVLSYPKFKLTAEDQEELLADYLPYCETVVIPQPPPITPPCRDPFDLPFLQLALAGKAQALVTGDQDLLTLASGFAIPVVSAENFVATLNSGQ